VVVADVADVKVVTVGDAGVVGARGARRRAGLGGVLDAAVVSGGRVKVAARYAGRGGLRQTRLRNIFRTVYPLA
jgi:hypothetical protein